MVNESYFSVAGYVATNPTVRYTAAGERTVSMRVGWTPRKRNAAGEWVDLPSSFVSVTCFRKVAEHAGTCLYKGEPVFLRGPLRVREYTDAKGDKRIAVEVVAESLGHDMARGLSHFSRVAARTGMTAEEAERAALAQPAAAVAGQDHQRDDEADENLDDDDVPEPRDAPDEDEDEDSPDSESESAGRGPRPLAELAGAKVPSSAAELGLSAAARS